MIESLLVANRGEIACRVIRTARRLGVRTLAVYSEADRGALHTRLADEAHCIGPPMAAESYLVGDRIVEVARERGAEAVHPGYGFLSENAEFAEACSAAGLVFVGPPAPAMRSMGLKDEAKTRMREAGVPVVPGVEGALDDAELLRAAGEIGYPVLVKAVAGGGGKGMRRVHEPAELEKALAAARREAGAAFGDDRLLLEKWIETPRHIEVQVFADAHGNCVHLFERDCSLQRRHQKVVEEAPAPGMTAELRDAMCTAAVRAAEAIGYEGAGTVEFVVDASGGLEKAPYYFIEMNTRLQVEHPVTEAIAGEDLVEWQLRVASGEALPRTQGEIDAEGPLGHAIEVRLYSEDPSKGYLPSTGTLGVLHFPGPGDHEEHRQGPGGGGLRVDTGVREGDAVTSFYDPLIAKLVAHGRDRAEALARMRGSLRALRVAGVATNAQLLANVCAHPAFQAGAIDTAFLETHAAALVPPKGGASLELLAVAALARVRLRAAEAAGASPSPWDAGDAFRLFGERREAVTFEEGRKQRRLSLVHEDGGALQVRSAEEAAGDGAAAGSEGDVVRVDGELDGDRLRGSVAGEPFDAIVRAFDGEVWVALEGRGLRLGVFDPAAAIGAIESGDAAVRAPMPGRVVEIAVEEGARVRRGAVLARMDAMKMEHVLHAPRDGVVERVAVAEGAQVEEGDVVVALREET